MRRRWDPEARLRRLLSLRGQLAQLRHVPRALRLVWSAAPGWTTGSLVLVGLEGLLPVLTVHLTRVVVDASVAVVGSRGAQGTLRPLVLALAAMALVLLAGELLGSLASYLRVGLAEQTQDLMYGLIHAQAAALDLGFYESPAYYDQLQRASGEALDRPLGLLESLSGLARSAITLAAMSALLLSYAWWLPVALLAGTLPALWTTLRSTWRYHSWRLLTTVDERRMLYYHRSTTLDRMAAELRLFDLGGHFAARHHELLAKRRAERLALGRQQAAGQAGASLAGLATMGLVLVWMARRAVAGAFSLGQLAMLLQAMTQGQRLMRSLLTGAGEIYRNLLFLEDLFLFLDLAPRVADPARPAPAPSGLVAGVKLTGVTFRYPESERPALSDFDLELPAGRITAIVGENGSGKSTLVKLLCRFHDPEAGRVTWDGVDLRDLAQAELRRRITVLFQQPAPYSETAGDVIAFGDLAGRPGPERVRAAARAAAADTVVDRLPRGFATLLGRTFGTTDLSVGEWQRLALARAFVRDADLVILDEPTSAMDSWAEAAWMARLRQLVAGRTALLITHRFTTAMQADVIHVMHEGRLVESGTHAGLVALGGRYAASWGAQMRSAEGAAP